MFLILHHRKVAVYSAIIINFSGIALGIMLLWIGGDFSVRYAVQVARAYRVSTFFIGFFMLAAGALIPDIMVAIISGIKGAGPLSAGEVIGANFCDITLVSGLSLFLAGSMSISARERRWLLTMLCLASGLMATNFMFGKVTRLHGILLIGIFAIFCWWVWRHEQVMGMVTDQPNPESTPSTISLIMITKLLGSFALVLIGSMLSVTFAVRLSTCCTLSLETIGATLMGIGTSLPELVVSLHALKRKEYGLALGPTLSTVLGQGTLILGLLAVISPEPIALEPLRSAAAFMFIAFSIIAYSIFKQQLNRAVGGVLISLFWAYLAYHLI